jgi:uncharacterized protein
VPHVAALWVAPVKGLRVAGVEAVDLEAAGARGDRAFHVRTAYGRVALTTRHGALHQVVPELDGDRLALRFPDGTVTEGAVALGRPVRTTLYDGRRIAGRVVRGPFGEALTAHLGREVQLVARDPAERAGDDAPVSLLARPSLGALAEAMGEPLDERRFRMTLAVDGTAPWEEHGWAGRELAAGDAVLRVVAPCVRCAVVTHHPESGETDRPVLKALGRLREDVALGVLLEVVRPGRVRVGDALALGSPAP